MLSRDFLQSLNFKLNQYIYIYIEREGEREREREITKIVRHQTFMLWLNFIKSNKN